jgi:hypothetical protein
MVFPFLELFGHEHKFETCFDIFVWIFFLNTFDNIYIIIIIIEYI